MSTAPETEAIFFAAAAAKGVTEAKITASGLKRPERTAEFCCNSRQKFTYFKKQNRVLPLFESTEALRERTPSSPEYSKCPGAAASSSAEDIKRTLWESAANDFASSRFKTAFSCSRRKSSVLPKVFVLFLSKGKSLSSIISMFKSVYLRRSVEYQ